MSEGPDRLHYIDNLRWTLIMLVIAVHASVTYGPVGGWFYYDRAGTDLVSGVFFTWISTISQTFFMGLMFFLAGYFSPPSLEKKGPGRFVAERLRKLGIPTLIFILIIGPGIVYFLNWSNTSLMGYYGAYLLDPSRYESGPLWFAIAVMVLTLAYVALKGRLPNIRIKKYGDRELFALAMAMAFGSFTVRLFYPIGSSIWSMQIPFFFQYVVLFALGIMARHNGWLEELPVRAGRIWNYLAIVLAVLALPVLMITGSAMDGAYPSFMGGPHWQSMALAMWEQTFCVAASVSILKWYAGRMNRENKRTRFLSKNSFAVYVFHAPVLIAISLMLVHLEVPIILKFFVVVIATVLVTYGFCDLLRRLPVFNGVL